MGFYFIEYRIDNVECFTILLGEWMIRQNSCGLVVVLFCGGRSDNLFFQELDTVSSPLQEPSVPLFGQQW